MIGVFPCTGMRSLTERYGAALARLRMDGLCAVDVGQGVTLAMERI